MARSQIIVDLTEKEDRNGSPYLVGVIHPDDLPLNEISLKDGLLIMVWPNLGSDEVPTLVMRSAARNDRNDRNDRNENK